MWYKGNSSFPIMMAQVAGKLAYKVTKTLKSLDKFKVDL